MNNRVTTVGNIKAVDITFKGGRLQSEIAKEIEAENPERENAEVPTSTDPKKIRDYYKSEMENPDLDSTLRELYKHTFAIVCEYIELKDENINLKLKLLRETGDKTDNEG